MVARKPKLLVTRRLPKLIEDHLVALFDTTLNQNDLPLDRSTLSAALMDFDAVCCTITDSFDATVLNIPKARVRLIANFGAGTDHVDLAAARERGVTVTNTPDALTDATAEIAIMLMLMAARRAGEGERELRSGGWSGWRPTHLIGTGISGKALGLIGFGRIAQATAARAAGFGMEILYHSRHRNETIATARYVDTLRELVAKADVLSVHIPGGPETHHLIDAEILRLMKSSAILVNTARGSVVDEGALALALSQRRIAAAGLDVFENEPDIHPALLACENVVLLPHLGSATIEARTAMGMQAARNLAVFFEGREPPNRVV